MAELWCSFCLGHTAMSQPQAQQSHYLQNQPFWNQCVGFIYMDTFVKISNHLVQRGICISIFKFWSYLINSHSYVVLKFRKFWSQKNTFQKSNVAIFVAKVAHIRILNFLYKNTTKIYFWSQMVKNWSQKSTWECNGPILLIFYIPWNAGISV